MNPYHHELWDYNIGVAEELVKLGFGEVLQVVIFEKFGEFVKVKSDIQIR